MIDLGEVNQVVGKAAVAALKRAALRVYSVPTTDSDGRDALLVTIVLRGGKQKEISGNTALGTIVRIQRDLRQLGEERFPIVEFVTEDELLADASIKS